MGKAEKCECGHLKGDHKSYKGECEFMFCTCDKFIFKETLSTTTRNLHQD